MGTTKSLYDQEAIEKIKEMAKEKICLFCTNHNNEIESRPMSTAGIDDDGTLWFFSQKDSEKNQQLQTENKVYLMYIDQDKHHYLSLTGTAEVVNDRKKVDELWNGFLNTWFEYGKDDPQVSLIKVTPEDGHYWDTKNGKLVTLIKIAMAAMTGNRDRDGSLEGDIHL